MVRFLAFQLTPILAALWIAGGSLVLLIEIIGLARALIRGDPIRTAFNAKLGGLGILFVALGIAFRAITEQDQGPEAVLLLLGCVSLLGGIAALFLLWPGRRQRT